MKCAVVLTILVLTPWHNVADAFVTRPQHSKAFTRMKSFRDNQSHLIARLLESRTNNNNVDSDPDAAARKPPPLQQHHRSSSFLQNSLTNAISSTLILSIILLLSPLPSVAANYASLTPEQKAVAEAWRIVDNSYLDRTFNGENWFQMRQDAVKRKYKSMDEARDSIESMIAQLGDKYTRYLRPAKYDSLVNSATGTLAGVGVEISVKDVGQEEIYVSDVEEKSPAKEGGIQKGDVFAEVDGVKVEKGKTTPDDVAGLLRGPEGSRVGVVMQRGDKTVDFILTRAKIKVTTVKSYLSEKSGVDGKVGVIRIKNFSGTTAATVADALEDLKKRGAKNFVLDLRRNPGGLLPGGVDTAGLFLDANKPIVYVVNKSGIVDSQSSLTTGIDLESPLVIFVDKNTASASEVMTAALKENGRAVVVGEQTFGKGIVQTVKPLSNNNGGVAVTVARYETPNHNDINKQGISVDMEVKDCESEDVVKCLPNTVFKKPEI